MKKNLKRERGWRGNSNPQPRARKSYNSHFSIGTLLSGLSGRPLSNEPIEKLAL